MIYRSTTNVRQFLLHWHSAGDAYICPAGERLVYRAVRQQGGTDLPAYNAALNMFRERHSETPDGEARDWVSHLIADASQRFPEWFWDGVGVGPVKKWWEH